MKKFLHFIFKLIIITVLSAVLLDLAYSEIYSKSKSRSKIQYVLNSEPQNYDVIFLGSSRANNHLDSRVFKKNGLKTFNFGISGSKLEESLLLLKLMIEKKNTIKNIIIEVDLNINQDVYSDGTRALFMPYFLSNKTINDYYKNLPEYNKLNYIPFYRYIDYDSKIGFRESFFSLINKKTNALGIDGFSPIKTNQRPLIPADLKERFPKKSNSYEEIKKVCAKNNITLIAITTPICTSAINRDYFNHIQSVYPEINRLENEITDDKYFSTCGHMNEKGASLFTQIVFNKFFKIKMKS